MDRRDWAPLTGLVRDRFKLIDLPEPELYGLSSDPGEEHNVAVARIKQGAARHETAHLRDGHRALPTGKRPGRVLPGIAA